MALVESNAEVVLHSNFSKFSPSREVALLERQIAFEPIALNLDGDHFAADFLTINPFHRIPVLVDEDLTVVESRAILDDREAKYPTPALSIPAETYL